MGVWEDELIDGCMSGWWVGPCILNKLAYVLCRGWVRVGVERWIGGWVRMDG